MSRPTGPISDAEMAVYVQRAVNLLFPEIAEMPHAGAFEMTASATGQRFRVTVAEVDDWSDQVEQELSEVIRAEAAS